MKLHDMAVPDGRKHVVIVGAGFAGLAAARELADRPEVQVTLVDQRNYHLFQPLLYQVATAGLNPSNIAVPIRAQFTENANVSVHLAPVNEIDLEKRCLGDGEVGVSFDYLILACGAQHSYFGKPEWEENAPGLKTLEQATEIRRRILGAFEQAENETDPEKQKALLTFVVVGAGPTGVELAGAIAEISRTVLVRDFRRINPASARVLLVEAGPRVLAAFPEDLSTKVVRDLEHLGVEVRTQCRVENVTADGVMLGGQWLTAKNTFWAAGVQASSLGKKLGVELDRAGRVKVNPDLSIPGHPNVFAVGDFAHIPQDEGKTVPGVAPAAQQTGKAAAHNILATVHGKERTPFRYRNKGQMATVGKSKAIVQVGKLRLTGRLAWIAWMFVHVFALVGFRNRATVFAEWVWNYLFARRGARLITTNKWRLESAPVAATANPGTSTTAASPSAGHHAGSSGGSARVAPQQQPAHG